MRFKETQRPGAVATPLKRSINNRHCLGDFYVIQKTEGLYVES